MEGTEKQERGHAARPGRCAHLEASASASAPPRGGALTSVAQFSVLRVMSSAAAD